MQAGLARRLVLIAALVSIIASTAAQAQDMSNYVARWTGLPAQLDLTHRYAVQIGGYALAAAFGFLIGAFLSDKFSGVRRFLLILIVVTVILGSPLLPDPLNDLSGSLISIIILVSAVGYGLAWGRFHAIYAAADSIDSTTFGSAKWATGEMLEARNLVGTDGLVIGDFASRQKGMIPLVYRGDRHLLTVAPTRSGKGVAAIIPNLLTYAGSALVVDPKGENAMVTSHRRRDGLGQKVFILDPWSITTAETGIKPACFNPLDCIDPDSPEASENAMMLADALVVPAPGAKEPFWDEEAKAILIGFILYVATDPSEADRRHLGRVRDLLLAPQEFVELMGRMHESPHPLVASAASRLLGMDPKLLANVMSSAQSHTHIFDSPRLRESLSRSDFRFEDLKQGRVTVYLVLPADRLNTFGRWLRIMVQQALTVTARDIKTQPERPILFLLDEMPALGRLAMVEQAYGLMAGFGMILWSIVQDLSQLHRVYGDGWQTFIGNAGVLQYFGSRDHMTADYFSKLCGIATVPTFSSTLGRSLSNAFSSGTSTSHDGKISHSSSSGTTSTNSNSGTYGVTGRALVMADVLMRIDSYQQLVLVENLDPIAARKIAWYEDERFMALGRNLREKYLTAN